MRLTILLACATSLFSQTASLTVQQGSASRNPTAGAIAHIWANPNTSTTVFSGWSGDTQYLLDPAAWHTTLSMPAAGVNLRATYRTVPAWTAQVGMFNNISVTYYVPPNPIGLIFSFHGTGGTGAAQFTGTEFLALNREAVALGFGVAAFDSLDRTTVITGSALPGQWNSTIAGAANPDVIRLNGILQAMRSQGIISAQLPLFAFGHSNGGTFSHFSSTVVPWAAISSSGSFGSFTAAPVYAGPAFWQLSRNDDHPLVGAKGNADALTNYTTHANGFHPARLTTLEPQPLYPARFSRAVVPTTLAESQEVYDLFRNKGWLDANDMLIQNPKSLPWQAALPAHFTANQQLSIETQLDVTYTTHIYSSETTTTTLDLFLRAIGSRSPLAPVNGASFLPGGIAPGSIDSLFVAGLAPQLLLGSAGPETGLGGVAATIRGSNNVENPAPWFFVSPGQGSFLTPADTAIGPGILKIVSGSRLWAIPATVARTAPGVFTVNPDGHGAPAATILRVTADNTQTSEDPFIRSLDSTGRYPPAPLIFGGDRLFLNLYATGVRLAGLPQVQVLLGGETVTPLFAGDQGQFPGLDQVTLELPGSFAGRGQVDVVVVANGVRSNPVNLLFGN